MRTHLGYLGGRSRVVSEFLARENRYRSEQPAKAGTCARDKRALQCLALNVHVKHCDLT